MAKTSSRKRMKPKPLGRKGKKKISPLSSESVQYVDYKDVELLKRFMSDRAKIRARRVSGNDSQQQREVARAIKNAREMGLLPYASRVTTQRRNNRRDDGPRESRDGGDRQDRQDRQNDRSSERAEDQTTPATAETTETGGEE